MFIRSRFPTRLVPAAAAAALALSVAAVPGHAALSEQGGTGIWEVQSAESARPARLELGLFSTYQRLGLRDPTDAQLNELIFGATAAFGLPGGFELSGSVPFYNPYDSFGGGTVPDDSEIDPKLGDLTARLRWTGPFIMPGMRWGFEGSAVFATGSNDVSTYPGRMPTQTFTVSENSYSGRAMMTWDGLRSGTGVPLRLHGNGGYTIQGDDTRYILPMAPLPLEVPAPVRNRDNDFLTLGAAAELDLPRMTLFGEVVTDQFVNNRTALKGKESRVVVTPGVRFWLPGGVSFGGAYTFNISDNDPATAFDPGRSFPKEQWRVALSLGTVYRGASARAEDLAIAATEPVMPEPVVAVTAAPTTVVTPVTPVATVVRDSTAVARAGIEREIISRRGVQEDPRAVVADSVVKRASTPEPAAAPAAGTPRAATPSAAPNPLLDTDGDGIPDSSDHCPLQPEDWDGFQDLDGCPELDNDQDGIPDVRDQCPNDPETFNGYYDFDGCPDEVQARWIGPSGASSERSNSKMLARPDSASGGPVAIERDSVSAVRRVDRPAAAAGPAAPLAPLAATAPATLPPAVNDTLRAELEIEKARVRMLEARAARAETERAALVERLLQPQAPAASDSAIARASAEELRQMILADRARNAEAAQRIQTLETRQEALRERPASPTTGGTTVVTPRMDGNTEMAARLAVLEARLANQEQARTTQIPVPAVPETVIVSTPPTSPSPEIIERLSAIEDAVTASRQDEEARSDNARLDLLLPVGIARVFPEIVFSTRSAGLSAAGVSRVNEIAEALRGAPRAMLRIIGHTDDRGPESVNLQLSRARASSVADMLYAQGVNRDQLVVEGQGEAAPLASNASADGRSVNRRVEFIRIR